ncbi:MAG: hypothetical protein ACO3DS_10665, partial [Phycisphaerales bacterium]
RALLGLVLVVLAVGMPGLAGQAVRQAVRQERQLPQEQQFWRPHASWMGRLILPPAEERQQRPGDWVWIELDQAPPAQAALIGQRLRLGWQELPELQELLVEAGFRDPVVHWEGTAKDGSGDGVFTPSRRGEACEAWIAYISAWRP